jgi:hypothetical protein
MRIQVEYAGAYEDCTGGGDFTFGGVGTASGTFTNCTGGDYAFGGSSGTASGTFTNCTGGEYAFGGLSGVASGTFTNCTAGYYAFAGGGTASGTFTNCTGGERAFGASGTASGTFVNCVADNYAFGGGSGDTTGGKFYGCRMTGSTWSGTFKGRMENCRWGASLTSCAAEARIYRSTILGSVNLSSTAAGIAHSAVKGIIYNVGSAAFNTGNLEDTDVN